MTDDSAPNVARGRDIEITFDERLCIHSRFCVLQAPHVFKANTSGEWIFPDALNAAALAAVARNCPSGALTYRMKEATLDEEDQYINLIRLRENGPYAVNARIAWYGYEGTVRRRTLRRCGAAACMAMTRELASEPSSAWRSKSWTARWSRSGHFREAASSVMA
jgi:uncharacterized Fe-S cluster protein YjdI